MNARFLSKRGYGKPSPFLVFPRMLHLQRADIAACILC
jgi:hypothetical protein